MDFVQNPYYQGKTIAAIATPPGEGGVAIVRISGDDALQVADKVFSKSVFSFKTHTLHYGHILDDEKKPIDDVLLAVMLGDKSYVGEDTVEIYCHGGSIVTRKVLERVIEAGAKAAGPGEFTLKAFMNGKIDLAQAEAVQELIHAKNEHAVDAARNQLEGAISKKIRSYQKQLTEVAAILEAWVDFPEEGLEFASIDEVIDKLKGVRNEMQELVDTYHDGKMIHEGISLCLVGSPNVGKSSLMNALLDKERAIVSHIPGTTRDIVEDEMRLNGLNLKLIDTAGIRSQGCEIEKEGMKRTKKAMEQADLTLVVLDISQPITDNDKELIKKAEKSRSIIVWNKVDLPHEKLENLTKGHTVFVSAKEGKGIDDLRKMIDQVIWDRGVPEKGEMVLTNARHKESLVCAIDHCNRLIQGLKQGISAEFVNIDMRSCLNELGKIIGTNITEDILTEIFSKFCIGK